MATCLENLSRMIIVNNLPEEWTTDHLQNYLEVETSFEISRVQTFYNFHHSALLWLEESVTDESVYEADSTLAPFCGQKLRLEPILAPLDQSRSLLVHYSDPSVTQDHMFLYFDQYGEVEECKVYNQVCLAVVRFNLPEDAKQVLGMEYLPLEGNLRVEPWFEPFHRPLLQLLLRKGEPSHPKNTSGQTERDYSPEAFADHSEQRSKPREEISQEIGKCRPITEPHIQQCVKSYQEIESIPKMTTCRLVTEHSQDSHRKHGEEMIKCRPVTEHEHGQDSYRQPSEEEKTKCMSVTEHTQPVYKKPFEEERVERARPVPKPRPRKTDHNPISPRSTTETYGAAQEEDRNKPEMSYSLERPREKMTTENMAMHWMEKTHQRESEQFQKNALLNPSRPMRYDHNNQSADTGVSVGEWDRPMESQFQQPRSRSTGLSKIAENAVMQSDKMAASETKLKEDFEETAPTVTTQDREEEKLGEDREREEIIKRLEEEVSKKNKELERLRLAVEHKEKQKAVSELVSVPYYMMRIIRTFVEEFGEESGCKVTLLEKEAQVLFVGKEEECQDAKVRFFAHIQKNVHEESLPVSEAESKVLESAKGKRFLDDLIHRHPQCGVQVRDTCVMCAALRQEDLDAFKKEFESKVVTMACRAPINLIVTDSFKVMTHTLEKEHLIVITIPTMNISVSHGGEIPIKLSGVCDDVVLAAKEMEEFLSKNRRGDNTFCITGKMSARAVKTWFSRELEEARQLILKNGEVLAEKSDDFGYSLSYHCPHHLLDDVTKKLDVIRDGLVINTVDLNKEFTKTTERVLVANGLKNMGKGQFDSRVQGNLEKAGLKAFVDFVLPKKCKLPKIQLTEKDEKEKDSEGSDGSDQNSDHSSGNGRGGGGGGGGGSSDGGDGKGGGGRGAGGRGRGRCGGGDGRRHSTDSTHQSGRGRGSGQGHDARHQKLPYTVKEGGTSVTVKTGDITIEKVEAAVCAIGHDLELKNTAIGKAFLNKCRSLSAAVKSSRKEKKGKGPCEIVTTAVPKDSQLPMSTLFHAVLTKKDDRDDVTQTVKHGVRHCLDKTSKKGLKSIALPPLGVGKRFGYGGYTAALATMTAIQEFLRDKPRSLKAITIVVYDDFGVADKFAQALAKTLAKTAPEDDPPKPSASRKEKGPSKWKKGWQKVAAFFGSTSTDGEVSGKFECTIYTTKRTNSKAVKDLIVKELRKLFLHTQIIDEKDVLRTLKDSLDAVAKAAREKNVLITSSPRGLKVCGQSERVAEVVATVRKEMYISVDQRQKADQTARKAAGLPTNTDHLPSYWTVYQQDEKVTYTEAITSWKKRGVRLNKVLHAEADAVKKLIGDTWDSKNVGDGNDAKGIPRGSSMKVIKVERLENPELWKEYSHRREKLFDDLVHHRKGSNHARCCPVDKLPGSKGPVLTSKHIGKRSCLARDIYPKEINEHYLFHGTKKDTMMKIYSQGLDFRLTSNGMLGKGVYCAECSTKSDQYTDDRKNRAGEDETLKMLLVRVLLGHPFLHDNKAPTEFKRPPCMSCQDEFCSCKDDRHESRFFNSVIDDGQRIFREFVLYGEHLCYPEYVITYKRVQGP